MIVVFLLGLVLLELRRLTSRVERVEDEVRYDIPPSRRQTIEGSILTVMRSSGAGAGAKAEPAGVAFFVSGTCALTAWHTLTLKRGRKQVTCVRASDRKTFEFDVVASDDALDIAVLRLRPDQPASTAFLTVPAHGAPPPAGDKGTFLVTCNIAMADEAPDVNSVGIAWHSARIVRYHGRHFMYDAQAFNGDSGGAIVVARTGEVIGLHQELVSHARELIEHAEDTDEQLNAIMVSIKSLIRSSAFGCVGLRLDDPAVVGVLNKA